MIKWIYRKRKLFKLFIYKYDINAKTINLNLLFLTVFYELQKPIYGPFISIISISD